MDSSSPDGIDVPNWKSEQPGKGKKESKMKIIRVGVDLAKNVFVRPDSRVSLCFTGEVVT